MCAEVQKFVTGLQSLTLVLHVVVSFVPVRRRRRRSGRSCGRSWRTWSWSGALGATGSSQLNEDSAAFPFSPSPTSQPLWLPLPLHPPPRLPSSTSATSAQSSEKNPDTGPSSLDGHGAPAGFLIVFVFFCCFFFLLFFFVLFLFLRNTLQ